MKAIILRFGAGAAIAVLFILLLPRPTTADQLEKPAHQHNFGRWGQPFSAGDGIFQARLCQDIDCGQAHLRRISPPPMLTP
jgi:hypothetical protein